jgi:hypothetical protein
MGVTRKKRCTFMVEPDVLEKLSSITARTGLSKSEQIRQGVRWWLESREWPTREGVEMTERGEQPALPRDSKRVRRRVRT